MNEFDIDDEGPGYVVFDMPVSVYRDVYAGKARTKPERALHPILAIRFANGEVVVPGETLAWVRNMIKAYVPAADIRRKLNAVGRLHEFAQLTVGERLELDGMVDDVVWAYLRARAENPLDPSQRLFTHWQPVRLAWVQTEFRDLLEFAKSCEGYLGQASVMGSAFKTSSDVWVTMKRSPKPDDFLAHLQVDRERWSLILGDDIVPAPPSALRRIAVHANVPKNGNDTTLSQEAIDTLIDHERNFMFKALWILLAYVGPRISEPLNMWFCDFLSPTDASRFFRTNLVGPVPIFADPWDSKYVGYFDSRRAIQTRTDYLGKYGLKPRPGSPDRRHSPGWKGMMTFNPKWLIAHGVWTCRKRAAEFADLLDQIREFHAEIAVTKGSHPYLFVNAKNREFLGEPLQLPNVEKAFGRACDRVGIDPDTPGASLHGTRHYYKWYARHELGLDEEIVQLMLRHVSLASQRQYGKNATDIYDAMNKVNARTADRA
ncbi:phage integrase family protein [Mesorhizobium sp. B2-4-17]|uniref:phage integrase family protein n=1 Tax=Mesorhizobium sp. B2-4-17 TaxID=2589932 RepID=UPI00112624E8|nr:phage integrase family protein [Mesorhizobium sp. B2-4-17]TPK85453.1 phage integrase family protein [Mesorhizobium sp. B2-4-17]